MDLINKMICLKHNKEIIGVIGAKSLCDECKIEMEENELSNVQFTIMWIITGIISFFLCLFLSRVEDGEWHWILATFSGFFGPLPLMFIIIIGIHRLIIGY